eukprot:TRINITY_DN11608_c1_g3_i1.p1 TRINITY_DN11608_c1_g3~~TRINITY_DN11608_c1_g3_i1.p1  ORF type:complete len:953 (+),score=208.71 TRINITY_DN11608_c1_g3_i1:140-2998(+)
MISVVVFQTVAEVLSGAKAEIGVFLLAAGIHYTLFSKTSRVSSPSSKKLRKKSSDSSEDERPGTQKTVGFPPTVVASMIKALKPLLRVKASSESLETALRNLLESSNHKVTSVDKVLGAVLEGLGRLAFDPNLLCAVRKVLRNSPGSAGTNTFEQLLKAYMAIRSRSDFNDVLQEAEASAKGDLPYDISILALQSEIGSNDLESSIRRLLAVLPTWKTNFKNSDMKMQMKRMIQQLVRLASEHKSVLRIVDELTKSEFYVAEAFEPIMVEAARHDDWSTVEKVVQLAEASAMVLTAASKCVILVRKVSKGESDVEVLNYFESELKHVNVLTVHTNAATIIAEAALRQNRQDILKALLSDCDDPRKVGLLKYFGDAARLSDAKRIFEACPDPSVCLHNTLLDAALISGDTEALANFMEKVKCSSASDVVTYNTLIKGHLQSGDLTSAMQLLETMRNSGHQPNSITFNELIDACASTNPKAAWALIGDMKACGVKPNKITCSILLKSLQPSSGSVETEQTLALLTYIEDSIDDVLLSSICEACIRTNRPDLLKQQLRRLNGPKAIQAQGAHTFGSLIRAYGFVQDLDGVWRCWRDMKSRQIQVTSITLGCMVEALVSNEAIEAGYQIIREVVEDEKTRHLVNSIMYGSILKGFCRQKRFNQVWTVYEEMLEEQLDFSIVTFNSLIDACARSGEIHRAQPLLEDMSKQGIRPNVITYSTILKGYCSVNRLDEAFALLEEMKADKGLRPDEVTYNTLLDGCARHGLFDRGMAVLSQMRSAGVPPSNFTLSVLAKLASRARKPDKAFELCEELSKEFNLRLNVHVYNNLIQACCSSGNISKGLEVLEQMLSEKVKPDPRSYALLLKACSSSAKVEDAVQLLRSAAGLYGGHPRLTSYSQVAKLRGGASALDQELLTEMFDFFCGRTGDKVQATKLFSDLRQQSNVKLSSKVHMRFAS